MEPGVTMALSCGPLLTVYTHVYTVRVMAETRIRTLRVPDDVWERAKEKATASGTTVSAVLLAALTRYVGRGVR